MVQRQPCAVSREVSARKGPTLPDDQSRWCQLPQRLHTPTPTSSQFSTARVRPARWHGPELPGVFRADPAPPDQVCAFAQVTGLRPKALGTAKTVPFRYPHWVYDEDLRTAFRRSEALSSTWWQVKDSNLRSFRDGSTDHRPHARDQRQCLSPDKLPGVFPTDSRRQPTSEDR